jgi:hypothetical protein
MVEVASKIISRITAPPAQFVAIHFFFLVVVVVVL